MDQMAGHVEEEVEGLKDRGIEEGMEGEEGWLNGWMNGQMDDEVHRWVEE